MRHIVETSHPFAFPDSELPKTPAQPDHGASHIKSLSDLRPGQEYIIHQPRRIGDTDEIKNKKTVITFTGIQQDSFAEGIPFGANPETETRELFTATRIGMQPLADGMWNALAWVEIPKDDKTLTAAKIEIIFDRALQDIERINQQATAKVYAIAKKAVETIATNLG